ncbi:hypothetical protein GCM10009540_95850 [Streptomyces turgidiscabies]
MANTPGFDRWQEQVRRTGGCANPIHSYSTADEPRGTAVGGVRQPACLALPVVRLDLRRGHLPPDPCRDHR